MALLISSNSCMLGQSTALLCADPQHADQHDGLSRSIVTCLHGGFALRVSVAGDGHKDGQGGLL